MAKISKEEAARREGISYAYRIAKERGLDALEEDIRQRNITGCPVGVDQATLDTFVNKVKENTLRTVLIVSATVLQDEFDFGKKRIERFIERFNLKASVLAEGYATWGDFQEQLRSELKIDISIPFDDKDVVIRKK